MTSHELANLLNHLRDGLGAALAKKASDDFDAAAQALRELPDQTLKDLVKGLQKLAAPSGGEALDRLLERVQSYRSGGSGSLEQLMKDVNKLKQAELQAVLQRLGHNPGKKKVAECKGLVRALLESPGGPSVDSAGRTATLRPPQDGPAAQIEAGFALFSSLRKAVDLPIEEIRARFAPLRDQPKIVLDEIARRLGYEFPGSKEDVAKQLLETLERMRISALRGELIKERLAGQNK